VRGTVRLRHLAATFARLVGAGRPHADLALALLVGLLAGGIYILTLSPGLVAAGDSPKMQYVGRILGTAHNPGYPLYVVLTHLASYIPVGSLAYRINLFSAICGACTVALAYAACRECGCNRGSAATVALSLGLGRVFWSQAVVAEVYTMAAALLALLLFAFFRWRRTQQRWWLYVGVGALGLSLGHHLTIVTVIPAILLFVAITEWRLVHDRRAWAICSALVIIGIAQYGYILLRSWQGVPGVESRAEDLDQLGRVIRGSQFKGYLFMFGPRELVLERLPLVATIVRDEVGGVVSLLLLALGSVGLFAKRRWADFVLLLGGASGPAFFAMNYGVPDVPVFLTLTFVLVAPLIGLGLTQISHRLPLALACGMLALPAWQLARNYGTNDFSRHIMETRFVGALFERLPRPCAVATNEYAVRHMLRYKILGEGQGQDVHVIPPEDAFVQRCLEKGWPVFAIGRARAALEALGYELSPMEIPCVPLQEYLAYRPGELAVVAAAGSSLAPLREAMTDGLAVTLGIGTSTTDATILCGVTGGRSGGRTSDYALTLRAGEEVGGTVLPVSLTVTSDRERVRILLGDRLVAETQDGALLVLLRPSDGVSKQYVLGADLLVPAGNKAFPVSRLHPRH
jgi:Protein of unknown function (DUF2723)